MGGNSTAGRGTNGGGINACDVALSNSTVTGNSISYVANGNGIFSFNVTAINSIVAGNSADGDYSGRDLSGPITYSNGHNIFGSDAVGAIIGDLQGVDPSLLFASIDPATGGGALNAAGVVILRDSVTNPALSGGDPLVATALDQLGRARPQPADSLPDIGAAESSATALSFSPSASNDVLTGTDGANIIAGLSGADLIKGRGGNDTLRGDDGSDVLDGGAGNDTLDGGDGVDLARFAGAIPVTIDLSGALDTAARGDEIDTLRSIQGAIGSSAGDTFTGDSGLNLFQGGGGRDVATGGAGSDIYDFDSVQDSPNSSAKRDLITDFSFFDRIDLTGIDADTTKTGNQAFRWVGDSALTGAGQLGVFDLDGTAGGDRVLRGSIDADAASEFEIQLNGIMGLAFDAIYL